MKPSSWSGRDESDFGPGLDLRFGDFHHITLDTEGMEFVVFSRGRYIVRQKKLGWQELFAVVFAGEPVVGENEDSKQ